MLYHMKVPGRLPAPCGLSPIYHGPLNVEIIEFPYRESCFLHIIFRI